MLDLPHDPGGKVRTALPAGMMGSAIISPCGRYRTLLTRFWSSLIAAEGYALWIGMNPSTADGKVNDPTVALEVTYTRNRLGLARYVKCNISDYRATHPKVLRALPPHELRSATNLPTILDQARGAERVIFAFGAIHPCLQPIARETVAAVSALEVPTFCLGLTKDGWPKHPLYLRADTPLIPYHGDADHG